MAFTIASTAPKAMDRTSTDKPLSKYDDHCGAGMAGTASDVLKFLETLRAGGLLQPQTRNAMFTVQARTRDQAEGPGWEFGFGGAVLVDPKATGTPQAPGTLQWTGAYGHKWFIDPANELTVVALTNTAFEGMIGGFTVDVRNAVYGV
jgi:CubicO group peptidase (beta-lactamase class C family)